MTSALCVLWYTVLDRTYFNNNNMLINTKEQNISIGLRWHNCKQTVHRDVLTIFDMRQYIINDCRTVPNSTLSNKINSFQLKNYYIYYILFIVC